MSNTKKILNESINEKVKSFLNQNNIVKGIYKKLISQIEDLKNQEDLLKFNKPKLNDIQELINKFENNNYKLIQQAIEQMNNLLKEGYKYKINNNDNYLLVQITEFLEYNSDGKYVYIERIKEEIESRNKNIVNVIINNQSIRTTDNNDLFSLNKDDLMKFINSLDIKENEIKSDITNNTKALKFYIDKFIIENLKTSIFDLSQKNESSDQIIKLEEKINSLERLEKLLSFGTVYFKINQDFYYSDEKERAKAGDILNYSLGDLISKVINNIANKTDDEIKEYI